MKACLSGRRHPRVKRLSCRTAYAKHQRPVLHLSHVASWLPFALVLLCPLMHIVQQGHWSHAKAAVSAKSEDLVDARPKKLREPG
ncbi:DUF2933 domain-containing protein [Cupriavidus sp. L7L]|uniref:DUF2933 domain-containing protein n=1 Tax=Cupriavidus sp. L7L TaxID=2546443 RepID=UPI001054DFA5|nr:DUF2933 domain-containing protein [Cupriavidus sp. L7L]